MERGGDGVSVWCGGAVVEDVRFNKVGSGHAAILTFGRVGIATGLGLGSAIGADSVGLVLADSFVLLSTESCEFAASRCLRRARAGGGWGERGYPGGAVSGRIRDPFSTLKQFFALLSSGLVSIRWTSKEALIDFG